MAMALISQGHNQPALNSMIRERNLSRSQARKVVKTARSVSHRMSEQQKIISKMTNWQRTKWNRAGSPMEIESVKRFANLTHWKQA